MIKVQGDAVLINSLKRLTIHSKSIRNLTLILACFLHFYNRLFRNSSNDLSQLHQDYGGLWGWDPSTFCHWVEVTDISKILVLSIQLLPGSARIQTLFLASLLPDCLKFYLELFRLLHDFSKMCLKYELKYLPVHSQFKTCFIQGLSLIYTS